MRRMAVAKRIGFSASESRRSPTARSKAAGEKAVADASIIQHTGSMALRSTTERVWASCVEKETSGEISRPDENTKLKRSRWTTIRYAMAGSHVGEVASAARAKG